MEKAFYTFTGGGGPLIATAIHDGHAVRRKIEHQYQLSEDERLREEDPYTARLAKRFPNNIVGLRSRFEVDLNRPQQKAIYQKPSDAWGLHVWDVPLKPQQVEYSNKLYEEFYSMLEDYLQGIIDRHGYVLVLDLHSYNHRREGPDGRPASEEENPEINLGTALMDLERWRPVVDAFQEGYKEQIPDADIRENVKFDGGNFMRWIHKKFGSNACVVAVEFKKVFMDEWTGDLDEAHFKAIQQALWMAGQRMEKIAGRIATQTQQHDNRPISSRETDRKAADREAERR